MTLSTLQVSRTALSAAGAEDLVRRWHRSVTDRVPVERLTPDLANGLRLDLPSAVVRGVADFCRWYADGRHLPLAGRSVALADVRVRLLSPVHAEVTATTTTGHDGWLARHEWWVVAQEEGPRIRTISVTWPDSATAASSLSLLDAA
ncbi:hypothetical protein [Streptomyces sp. B6B3]|uniref:hypothetical protein n=1 Tax=Streptomyces sp. B6B3 TaxID=3153570 RepID=UPI00325F455B